MRFSHFLILFISLGSIYAAHAGSESRHCPNLINAELARRDLGTLEQPKFSKINQTDKNHWVLGTLESIGLKISSITYDVEGKIFVESEGIVAGEGKWIYYDSDCKITEVKGIILNHEVTVNPSFCEKLQSVLKNSKTISDVFEKELPKYAKETQVKVIPDDKAFLVNERLCNDHKENFSRADRVHVQQEPSMLEKLKGALF